MTRYEKCLRCNGTGIDRRFKYKVYCERCMGSGRGTEYDPADDDTWRPIPGAGCDFPRIECPGCGYADVDDGQFRCRVSRCVEVDDENV
jgi:DnaJ-class molecular chaperone